MENKKDLDDFEREAWDDPTVDQQISWLEKKRDKFSAKPSTSVYQAIIDTLLHYKKLRSVQHVDVVKVIEDLITEIKWWAKEHSCCSDREEYVSAIQNGEAALGMLQALKEKRFTGSPITENKEFNPIRESVTQQVTPDEGQMDFRKINLKPSPILIKMELRNELQSEIENKLPHNVHADRSRIANAILYAIESYLTIQIIDGNRDNRPV